MSNGKGGPAGPSGGGLQGLASRPWPPALPPWGSPAAWGAATLSLDHHLKRPAIGGCRRARRKAAAIATLIERLDPPMGALCAATCPDCRAPCCGRATVWYDLADLLVLAYTGRPWPDGQPMAAVGEPCRHLGPAGCRLPRLCRPWVCTWYLCPDQMALVDAAGGGARQRLTRRLRATQRLRKALERAFIRAALGS